MNARIELERDQIQLLDEALRIAYTRLVETSMARGYQFHQLRDVLVAAMVNAILRGETDAWRVARRGLFSACDAIAHGHVGGPNRARSAAA